MDLGQVGVELLRLFRGTQSFCGPGVIFRQEIQGHAEIGPAGVCQGETGVLPNGLVIELQGRHVSLDIGLAPHHVVAFQVEFVSAVVTGEAQGTARQIFVARVEIQRGDQLLVDGGLGTEKVAAQDGEFSAP